MRLNGAAAAGRASASGSPSGRRVAGKAGLTKYALDEVPAVRSSLGNPLKRANTRYEISQATSPKIRQVDITNRHLSAPQEETSVYVSYDERILELSAQVR